MQTQPPAKKSETLEIRLPFETKQAFMAACRADGRTASEALRGFIDGRLTPEPAPEPAKPRRVGWLRIAAGGLIALAVGASAVPSLARPLLEQQIGRLDVDRDGSISLAEFARLDRNHDGKVSLSELSR